MKKDYRPFFLVRLAYLWRQFFVSYFLIPQFNKVGAGLEVWYPKHIEVFGSSVQLGNHVHLIANKTQQIQFCCWEDQGIEGKIKVGNFALISPGVRIQAAKSIVIEDNCMLASNVYISDADWHGIYNRIDSPGKVKPIHLEKNCWIGDGAKIGKGVRIGKNSIVAQGAVVVKDVPQNVIVGGNPAKLIKYLDPSTNFTARESLFLNRNLKDIQNDWIKLQKASQSQERLSSWIRQLILPK